MCPLVNSDLRWNIALLLQSILLLAKIQTAYQNWAYPGQARQTGLQLLSDGALACVSCVSCWQQQTG